MSIKDYGWNDHFEQEWRKVDAKGILPARVVADYGQTLRVIGDTGELLVNRPRDKFRPEVQIAVGDWVALEIVAESQAYRISFVLPRKTKFSRAAA